MKQILFWCCMFLSATLFAQKALYEVSLDKVIIHTTLKGFRIIDVIDGRENKHNIGWVQKGINNRRKIAIFKNSLSDEINAFIRRSFYMPDEPSVILRITQLSIGEHTTSVSETSMAKIAIEYYLKEDDRYYYLTNTYCSIEKGGLDVTFQHPDNIGQALVNNMHQFAQINWNSLINRREYFSVNELHGSLEIIPYPMSNTILEAENYNEGVYKTFEEFLYNNPSISENYEVINGSKIKLIIAEDSKERKIKEGIYGFAHQNKLYILFQKSFYPLKKGRDDFYFIGPKTPNNAAVTNGIAIGGLVGGAIAASTSTGNSKYRIDMNNGSIIEIR